MEALDQVARQVRRHLQRDIGMAAREGGQHAGEMRRREILRRAEPHDALQPRLGELRQRLFRQRQDAPPIGEQRLARRGEAERARGALDQAAAERLLQPLQLQADGGLAEAQALAGARDVAGRGDGDEGAQEVVVEADHAAIVKRNGWHVQLFISQVTAPMRRARAIP